MNSQFTGPLLKIGANVTFDCDKIEIFKNETSGQSTAIRDYQRLVLAGINQVGKVVSIEGNLTTVSYQDGWQLPIPSSYLLVLPEV